MTFDGSNTPAPDQAAEPEELNLKQVARALGLHYMTVYRYVRQGTLPARRVGNVWMVASVDVTALAAKTGPPPPRGAADPSVGSGSATETPKRSGRRVDWAGRLVKRLLSGDEVGGWTVVRDALSAGHDVQAIHLGVVADAIGRIGHQVAAGTASSVDERIAVATASRLLVRLGAQFPHRGRKRGTVVLAAPEGEHHGLPLLLVANLIRHAGFRVVELGTDTPAADVVEAVTSRGRVLALGLGVTTVARLAAAEATIAAVRAEAPDLPVLLGGQAVRNREIAEMAGATVWSAGPDLVEQIERLTGRRSRAQSPSPTAVAPT